MIREKRGGPTYIGKKKGPDCKGGKDFFTARGGKGYASGEREGKLRRIAKKGSIQVLLSEKKKKKKESAGRSKKGSLFVSAKAVYKRTRRNIKKKQKALSLDKCRGGGRRPS